MGLKFMQRRQQQQQARVGLADTPPVGTPAAAAATTARPAWEWTLDVPHDASASSQSCELQEVDAEPDAHATLLSFRAGRRSFGSFNPRLEKRLAEIRDNQRLAAEERVTAERVAEERRKQQEAQDALQQKADAEEAKERESAVSDADMAAAFASKYARYVPQVPRPQATKAPNLPVEPPVVENPVRILDAPAGSRQPNSQDRNPSMGNRGPPAKKPKR